MALGAPGALAGCATYVRPVPKVVVGSWHLLLSGNELTGGNFPPGFPSGLGSLVDARAIKLGVGIVPQLSAVAADQATAFAAGIAQSLALKRVIVVQAVDVPDMAGRARAAIAQGVDVISYLQPLPYQSAQITADGGSLGALLATDVAAWAHRHGAAAARAIFVADPTNAAPGASPLAEQAIRVTLGHLAPRIELTAVQSAADAVHRLAVDRSARIVLCSSDYDATQVAGALRRQPPPPAVGRLYVGGIGSPSVGPQTLSELRLDGVLRAVATVRQQDLADALVDLPAAILLQSAMPRDVRIPPVLLTPRSLQLTAYERIAALPETGIDNATVLGTPPNLSELESAREHQIEVGEQRGSRPSVAPQHRRPTVTTERARPKV